jgi:hypothetical protein
VNISRLNDLRCRSNPDNYIAEFRELIDAIGERKLSNNVFSFLCALPQNMRRGLYKNEQNLSSMENIYKAFVRIQTLKRAESAYKTCITKYKRICRGCVMKGHIKQFCGNNKYMDNC